MEEGLGPPLNNVPDVGDTPWKASLSLGSGWKWVGEVVGGHGRMEGLGNGEIDT